MYSKDPNAKPVRLLTQSPGLTRLGVGLTRLNAGLRVKTHIKAGVEVPDPPCPTC
jgi:hypothetical protein